MTVTVRAATYSVDAEPDIEDGRPILHLTDQLGGEAGYIDPSRSLYVVGAPAWWSRRENRKAARAAVAAYLRQCRHQPVPAMPPHTASDCASEGEPIGYRLTAAGRSALAIDEAIQVRMDTTALDEIASLLRHADSADPVRVLALIGEQVAATRRTVRAEVRTG
ncbi:MAG: hypothetical protein ABI381_07280 [Jatrophihabitantaceae bacterium]